jgi:hypothetical protein
LVYFIAEKDVRNSSSGSKEPLLVQMPRLYEKHSKMGVFDGF